MELKYILLYGCLVAVGNLAGAAKIFGGAGIDSSSAGVQAGVSFPKIPGINSPILGLSIFPTASSTDNWNLFNNLFPRDLSENNETATSDGENQNQSSTTFSSGNQSSTTPSSGNKSSTTPSSGNQNNTTSSSGQNQSTTPASQRKPSFLQQALSSMLPDVNRLVPNLPNLPGNLSIPSIRGPPSLDSLPRIPGLSNAINTARNHVQTAINATGDFADGIETSLRQALESGDSTGAVRTLVNTILNGYLTVAENCPAMIVANRVLREGIRLAVEVARSARNVAFGTQ